MQTNVLRSFIEYAATRLRKAAEESAKSGKYMHYVSCLDEVQAEIRSHIFSTSDVARELEILQSDSDYESGNLLINIASSRPSEEFVTPLCSLLDKCDISLPNEDIIEVLGEIRDPRAVPSLTGALSLRIPSDFSHSLQRKAIHSLIQIGTPAARAALEAFSLICEEEVQSIVLDALSELDR